MLWFVPAPAAVSRLVQGKTYRNLGIFLRRFGREVLGAPSNNAENKHLLESG